MLPKHAIVWCSILWFCLQGTSVINSQCVKCKGRSFETAINDCFCEDKQFCNNSSKCEECGYCFHFWNNITENTKDDIFIFVKKVIENYDFDVDALQKLMKNIFENILETEKVLPKIDAIIHKSSDNNVEVLKNLKELQTNLKLVKESLDLYRKDISNTQKFTTFIEEVLNKVNQIFNNITKINVNSNWESNLQNLTHKLNEIRAMAVEDTTFQNLNNNSLNLALDLESNIIFLEFVSSKHAGYIGSQNRAQYNETLISLGNDVEALKSFVIIIIRDYLTTFDYIKEVKELHKHANRIYQIAKEIDENLKSLLVEERRFWDLLELLRQAKIALQEILYQRMKLSKINEDVRNLDKLSERFQHMLKTVENDLNDLQNQFFEQISKYKHDKTTTDAKLQKIQELQPILEKLLQKVLIQKEAIEQLEEVQTIDEMENEIEAMSKETEKYIGEIVKYCRVEAIPSFYKQPE